MLSPGTPTQTRIGRPRHIMKDHIRMPRVRRTQGREDLVHEYRAGCWCDPSRT